jgi:homoserine kinase
VGTQLRYHRLPIPAQLVAVVAIPPYEVKTSEARRILPQQFSRAEGVTSLQRSALITAVLASGEIEQLSGLFADSWHEHYRSTLTPGLNEARRAAQAAGAIGTILSGSGSTVLSFSHVAQAEAVRVAMHESYHALGIQAATRILPFDNEGLTAI